MAEIEIFVQSEALPEITLVRVPADATVRDLVRAALPSESGGRGNGEAVVMLEDSDEVLKPNARLDSVGIKQRSRVHIGRCRHVDVTVNFNGLHKDKKFPPSATVGRVKKWAVRHEGFNLSEIDAAEHVLQLCGSDRRPDEDTHIGTLVSFPNCALCFDLVPKKRVEG